MVRELDPTTFPDGVTKCKKVYIECQGIKKRERTVKNHSFRVGYYSPETQGKDLEALALQYVKDEMRSMARPLVSIRLMRYEIEITGGLRIEKFSSDDVFNAEKFSFEVP